MALCSGPLSPGAGLDPTPSGGAHGERGDQETTDQVQPSHEHGCDAQRAVEVVHATQPPSEMHPGDQPKQEHPDPEHDRPREESGPRDALGITKRAPIRPWNHVQSRRSPISANSFAAAPKNNTPSRAPTAATDVRSNPEEHERHEQPDDPDDQEHPPTRERFRHRAFASIHLRLSLGSHPGEPRSWVRHPHSSPAIRCDATRRRGHVATTG